MDSSPAFRYSSLTEFLCQQRSGTTERPRELLSRTYHRPERKLVEDTRVGHETKSGLLRYKSGPSLGYIIMIMLLVGKSENGVGSKGGYDERKIVDGENVEK